VVLDIDNDNRKLSLGHKQIEEDPWDTFETVFPVGSIHEASVMTADDKGAVVLLPYGLEGYSPKKHTAKENGGYLVADEKVQFKVLEFNRNDKRILLSHARVWEDAKRQGEEVVKTEKKQEQATATKKVKEIQKSIEKSTLGDLSALSDLKEKMDTASAKKDAAAKEAKTEVPVAPEAKPEAPVAPEEKAEAPVAEAEAPAAEEAKVEAPKEEKPAKKAKKEAPKEDASGDLFAPPAAAEEKAPE